MKKVSAFQSVRILPKPSRSFLSEDGVNLAVPMQTSMHRPSVDRRQGDVYTVARNIRVMALQPYESGVLNPVGKLHSPKLKQRGYRSRKQVNKYRTLAIVGANLTFDIFCRQLSIHSP